MRPEVLSPADVENHAGRLLPRFDLDRAADAVGDEAALVGAVVERVDLRVVDVTVEGDLGAKYHAREPGPVHRPFRRVFVSGHPDSLGAGQGEEPQHVTARQRGDEHLLGICLARIAAEDGCARRCEPLVG